MTINVLDANKHQSIKINIKKALLASKNQQIISLTVAELARAACCFATFLVPSSVNGKFGLAALAGFEQGKNVFVDDERWLPIYLPVSVKTHPFQVIGSQDKDKPFAIAVDESSDALSAEDGEDLYDESGKQGIFLQNQIKILESNVNDLVHTTRFIEILEKHSLIKPLELIIVYEDDSTHKLTGLHTIDEEKLAALEPDMLAELNKRGYLIQIHAMLMSLYQVNHLIRVYNATGPEKAIRQATFQLVRST